jgi:hypothetical protein
MRFNRKDSTRNAVRAAAFFPIPVALCLLLSSAFAGDLKYDTVYAGILDKAPTIKSTLIRSGGELDRAKEALGISGALPPVDFGKDSLILIADDQGTGGIIGIQSVDSSPGGLVEVRYAEELTGPLPRDGTRPAYTYLIARLSPAPGKGTAVRFVDESYMNRLASGTGLGQFGEYTNVLSGEEGVTLAEFLPLEKGNKWTYRAEAESGSSEVTNSVVSESDGWSVFDKFFGISGVGMKIAPGGEIYVASKGGIKTFYNSDVLRSFPKTEVKTPAGDFGDVMVVSMPEGGDFWFRDVYAKGIGLVYHEQKSPRGRSAYTLVSARVGGTEYPRRKTTGRKEN